MIIQHTGKYIVLAGLILVIIGGIVWLLGDKLSFIGRLPGDIHIRKENFSIYIPLTTMLLLSVLLSAVLWLIRRIL